MKDHTKTLEAVEAYRLLMLVERRTERSLRSLRRARLRQLDDKLQEIVKGMPLDATCDFLTTAKHIDRMFDGEVESFDVPAFFEKHFSPTETK